MVILQLVWIKKDNQRNVDTVSSIQLKYPAHWEKDQVLPGSNTTGSSRLFSETGRNMKQTPVAQSAPWQQPTERLTADIIEVRLFKRSQVISVNIPLIQQVKVSVSHIWSSKSEHASAVGGGCYWFHFTLKLQSTAVKLFQILVFLYVGQIHDTLQQFWLTSQTLGTLLHTSCI